MPTLVATRGVMDRFTLDGSDALEARLAHLCRRILLAIERLVPRPRLEGLVLGGGYGRGQGGVLKTQTGDQPYNDLEFYVFMRGSRLANARRYGDALNALGEQLSPEAGLHVEFKVDSLAKLRRSPVSMFSYDLVVRHRTLCGGPELFRGCEHHLASDRIPAAEATRLLLNRCTGLLLAKELMTGPALTMDQADFIGRNLRKAQLALGDALLCFWGQYHWSCLERQCRLDQIHMHTQRGGSFALPPGWTPIRQHHSLGVQFKLHPQRFARTTPEFAEEHHEVADLTLQLWLWLESHRLGFEFSSPQSYALSSLPKWAESAAWRNILLNLATFGARSVRDRNLGGHPRERLLHSLPLLLWNGHLRSEPEIVRFLQQQLHSPASDWAGLVQAYKKLWARFG